MKGIGKLTASDVRFAGMDDGRSVGLRGVLAPGPLDHQFGQRLRDAAVLGDALGLDALPGRMRGQEKLRAGIVLLFTNRWPGTTAPVPRRGSRWRSSHVL